MMDRENRMNPVDTLIKLRHAEEILEKAGIEQHMTAVEECATVLRGLVSGERTSVDGEAFKIDGMKLRTDPPDAPVRSVRQNPAATR